VGEVVGDGVGVADAHALTLMEELSLLLGHAVLEDEEDAVALEVLEDEEEAVALEETLPLGHSVLEDEEEAEDVAVALDDALSLRLVHAEEEDEEDAVALADEESEAVGEYAAEHEMPQPQKVESETSTSHPSDSSRLQSAWEMSHTMEQVPALHDTESTPRREPYSALQSLPQLPQLFTSA